MRLISLEMFSRRQIHGSLSMARVAAIWEAGTDHSDLSQGQAEM